VNRNFLGMKPCSFFCALGRNKGTEEKGRIVYEAENADWDDEDPDDDLEI